MRLTKKMRIALLLSGCCLFQAQARNQLATPFLAAVQCAAFDTTTSNWYLGLNGLAGTETSIRQINYDGNTITDTAMTSKNPAETDGISVDQLALSVSLNDDGTPYTAVVFRDMTTANKWKLSVFDPATVATDGITRMATALQDSAATALTAESIKTVVASDTFVFAAHGLSTATLYGAAGSGISVVRLFDDAGAFDMSQMDAKIGLKALPKAFIADGVVASSPKIAIANNATLEDHATLCWSKDLQRLYLGLNGSTGGVSGDSFCSVSCMKVDSDSTSTTFGKLEALNLKADGMATFSAGTSPVASNVVGAITTTTTAISMRANHLGVMKNSAGNFYLIVNGGFGDNGAAFGSANKVFALPLVGLDDNGEVQDTSGTLASVAISTTLLPRIVDFSTQAADSSALFTEIDVEAIVGCMPIYDNITTVALAIKAIEVLQIVGDTVFATVPYATTTNDEEPGVFYSQAILDAQGQITGWTLWARAMQSDPAILPFFSAVDPTTGHIMSVSTSAKKQISATAWESKNSDSTSKFFCASELNNVINGPCYSALSIDQSIIPVGSSIASFTRYVLFGGDSSVTAAIISSSNYNGTFNDANQSNDLSSANTLSSLSSGLEKAGAITSIAITHIPKSTGKENFLLAGSASGLYKFAAGNGDGFDITTIAKFDITPFSDFTWQKVADVKGDVRKIVSDTKGTFVLARDNSGKTVVDRVYTILNDSLTSLGGYQVIAESGKGSFASAGLFLDIALVPGAKNGGIWCDQMVIATNNGLWVSTNSAAIASNPALQIGVSAAFKDADCAWISYASGLHFSKLVSPSFAFMKMTSDENLSRSLYATQWVDRNGRKTFNASTLDMFAVGNQAADTVDNLPDFVQGDNDFIDDNSDSASPLDPMVNFWTDGARRFFITQSGDRLSSSLNIYPYNVYATDFNESNGLINLTDGDLSSVNRFYWIKNVGGGFVMAGTDQGVVVLQ